jgi:hypothetical protein
MEIPQTGPHRGTTQEGQESSISEPSEKKEKQEFSFGEPNEMSVKQHKLLPHLGGRRIYQQPSEAAEEQHPAPVEGAANKQTIEQKQENSMQSQCNK